MKRYLARLVALCLIWWAIPFTPDVFDAQSAQNRTITVLASAAQTANGNGNGVDVSSCLNSAAGTSSYQMGAVIITASSGTLTAFKVWLEGSVDGTNRFIIPAWNARSMTATVFTANTELMVNETAIQAASIGIGYFSIPLANVRAKWTITPGASPSETFSVVLTCYS